MADVIGGLSPTTGNYLIGKGFILIKEEGASVYRHVGNVPSLEITPAVDTLDHFSSMEGTKAKDETIVLTKSGQIKMTMEEITAKNIALLMLGDVVEDGYGGESINLFSRSSITSAFRFYGNNDKGPRWFFDLPKVIWNPSGAFAPISDQYANLQATGEWTADNGNFGTATLKAAAGTVAPENVLVPIIGGDKREGGTLKCFIGGWIGATAYTYVWKNAAVAISGPAETDSTYVVRAGDAGDSITCTVTATNAIGSTSATTAAVVAFP